MQKAFIALLVAVAVAMAGAPAVADEVGASGQCYDSNGNGGEDSAGVNTGGEVTTPTVTGAADAVATLAQGTVSEGPGNDACTGADDGDQGKDYAEAHVAGNQVCYDKDGFRTDGGCPTSPGQDDV